MSEIKLKNEGLPKRCEICHQIDCFDAVNNYCQRCSNLLIHYQPHHPTILTNNLSLINRFQNILENFGLSIGQVFAITLMLSLTLLGAIVSNLTAIFLEKQFFITTSNIMALITAFGAAIGFLSLTLIAKLTIRYTNMKLAPFIDFKVKILIKNSVITK